MLLLDYACTGLTPFNRSCRSHDAGWGKCSCCPPRGVGPSAALAESLSQAARRAAAVVGTLEARQPLAFALALGTTGIGVGVAVAALLSHSD